MKDTEYGNVKIPMGLLLEVDKIVSTERNGFRSRNEFCVHAIREILKEYRNNYQPDKQHRKKKDRGSE